MQKNFIDANVLIMGGGVSGVGAKYALERRGAHCFLFDDSLYSTIPKIPYDYIVVSPSITKQHYIFDFAAENNIPIISEIELGYIFNEGKIVAVTGTNGKTTVTELITQILNNGGNNAVSCGNIGVSFALSAVQDGYDTAVVEVSSFQLENVTNFAPDVAIITNISPDHLDRHGSMENYGKLKLKISAYQNSNNYLVLSADDIPLWALEGFTTKAQVLFTSVKEKVRGAYLLGGNIYYFDELICPRDSLRLGGNHNVSNALCAICAAKLMGISTSAIVETLGTFEADAHRMKYVASVNSKAYYNDSKGTNIGATVCAAAAMPSSTCLILGGSDKGYEYDELFNKLPDSVKRVVAIGETANKITEAAKRQNFNNITCADSLLSAVEKAAEGDEECVLLSPASASFDMFKNYKDRGEQFEKIVLGFKDKA